MLGHGVTGTKCIVCDAREAGLLHVRARPHAPSSPQHQLAEGLLSTESPRRTLR